MIESLPPGSLFLFRHHGESSKGMWKLTVSTKSTRDTQAKLDRWNLTIYGISKSDVHAIVYIVPFSHQIIGS